MAGRAYRWVLGLLLALPQVASAAGTPAPDPDFEALLEYLGEAPEAGETWDQLIDSLPPEGDLPAPPPAPELDIVQ